MMNRVCDFAIVLPGMTNRVILGVRGGFLKQRQEPAVTSALWVRDDSPTQRQWNQEVVWRAQETDPRNEQAPCQKLRIWIPNDTIALNTRRQVRRLDVPAPVFVIGRRGDRQLRADRLDPVLASMRVEDRDQYFPLRQLGVLPFQLLEPLSLRQRGIAPWIRPGLGPLDPRAQRLGLLEQPHGSLTYFGVNTSLLGFPQLHPSHVMEPPGNTGPFTRYHVDSVPGLGEGIEITLEPLRRYPDVSCPHLPPESFEYAGNCALRRIAAKLTLEQFLGTGNQVV